MEVNKNIFIILVLMGISHRAMSENLATSEVVKKSSSQVVPSCNPDEKAEGFNISFEKLSDVVNKRETAVISLEEVKCYLAGQKAKVFAVEEEASIVYKRALRGEVTIAKVQKLPFENAKNIVSLLLTKTEKAKIEDELKRRSDKNSNVWVLTVKDFKPHDMSAHAGGAPAHHPQAETIQFKELKQAMDGGAPAYDVRPKELYGKGHLKGSINVDLKKYEDIASKIISVNEMRNAFTFTEGIFPKDKKSTVYIYSACAGEFSSYNMITLLRDHGYKNIKWFRGGMASRKNAEACITPTSLDGVSVIEADEVAQSLKVGRSDKEKAIVYDLRSRASHDTVGIPGMISLTMVQKLNPLGLPVYRDPHLTPETLLRHKEKMKGLSDRRKDVPIILVGENEYDWAPYKTAVILKGMGFKNIRWYRKGVVEWKLRHIFDKEKFPLSPEPAFKMLDL